MATPRRPVHRSALFLETAHGYFPSVGSADGGPSFDLFERGPLRAVEDLCAVAFEQMAEPYPGIRAWTTIELPFFPPMTFFALLDTSGTVELIDLTVDTEFDWGSSSDP